jgi:hypothetical protein
MSRTQLCYESDSTAPAIRYARGCAVADARECDGVEESFSGDHSQKAKASFQVTATTGRLPAPAASLMTRPPESFRGGIGLRVVPEYRLHAAGKRL